MENVINEAQTVTVKRLTLELGNPILDDLMEMQGGVVTLRLGGRIFKILPDGMVVEDQRPKTPVSP